MSVWEFDLPYKRPPLSLNGREHWAVRARVAKELRLLARLKCRHVPDMGRCRVTLVWWVNDRRRRDSDNPIATLKPLADGVTDAGVVTDDDHTRMEKRVEIIYVPKIERVAGLMLRVEDITETKENQ